MIESVPNTPTEQHAFLVQGPLSRKKILRTKINRPEVSCKKDVLKSIVKFTGKHPLWCMFFNKVADLKVISLCICKIFKSTFFYSRPPVAVSEKRLFSLFGILCDKFFLKYIGVTLTAWNVTVFASYSGPFFSAFGLNMEIYWPE